MLRRWHLLRQPFAVAPIRCPSSHIVLASAIANQAVFLHQILSPISSPRKIQIRGKHVIDKSLVPSLDEDDLEEQFIKGSGPGGSKVNKTVNCCLLKHKPTGIIVKCHLSRILEENRKLARQMLIEKLDDRINGDMSIRAQKERLMLKKSEAAKRKSIKMSEQKKRYQELLEDDSPV